MSLQSIARRHPIAAYFFSAGLISWGGAFMVTAPRLLSGQAVGQTQGLLMFPIMLFGPSVAAIALTGMLDGRSGLRDLRARMSRWRVGAGWYAAVFIPPVLILAVLSLLRGLLSPVFSLHLFPCIPGGCPRSGEANN